LAHFFISLLPSVLIQKDTHYSIFYDLRNHLRDPKEAFMLIKDWMATTILTVDANTSVMRATRTMKENNIRRLPVLSHGKLAGIITDRDLKDASPSSKTDMDLHEMYYLLSEMKVKDVMTGCPIFLKKDDTLEKAALVMLHNKISGLVIVDDNNNLVGLLSESDVLRGFIHATGIQDGAYQFVIDMSDAGGSVSWLVDILRQHKARILSILTSFNDAPPGFKRVSVRILPEQGIEALANEIAATSGYNIVSQSLDDLSNLPKK
jgi:acetoin utilization protein AcuB